MAILSCTNDLSEWQLSGITKQKLLKIVKLSPPKDVDFLASLERAIQLALTVNDEVKTRGPVKRSDIKKAFVKISKLSTSLKEELEQLPLAAYQLFHDGPGVPELIRRMTEIQIDLQRANVRAVATHSGRGADINEVPYMLVADIAWAFEKAGLKFSTSQNKTISGQVVSICFEQARCSCEDMREYLRKGVMMHKGRKVIPV